MRLRGRPLGRRQLSKTLWGRVLVAMLFYHLCHLGSLKCVVSFYAGEGDGSPLQHSCLENPVDGGGW